MDQMVKDRSFDPVWDEIEAHLLNIKRAAMLELRNYPQPIAGCDAQIPALWEKRDGIAAELDRLAASRQKAGSDAANAITAFIATSDYLDENTTAAINNTLNQRLRDTAAIDRSAAE
jgi:hypothetical protein